MKKKKKRGRQQMQWFRLYAEFATDPKVQMMPESYQRRLIMLFCNRCNVTVALQDDEVTFLLRITTEEWALTKAEFIKRGFIDADNNIINWEARQFVSDSSNQRVKRHRDKKKQDCNVTVTPPDTEQKQIQNRTEQKKTDAEFFEDFWSAYPTQRKGNRDKSFAAWRQALKRADAETILEGLSRYVSSSQVSNGYGKGAAAWLNDDRWTWDYSSPKNQGQKSFHRKHQEAAVKGLMEAREGEECPF